FDGVRRSARVGLLFTIPIAVVATAGGLAVIPQLAWSDRLLLGVGGMGVVILSPIQDHVRRILHQAFRSPPAMEVSSVQLLVAVAAVAAMDVAHLDPLFIPLAALALANGVSLCVGLLFAWLDRGDGTSRPPSPRSALRLGYFLLVATGSEQLGNF